MLPPKKRQPGEYIRKLGKHRQQSAILRYALAGGVFVGTLFLVSIFSNSSVGIVLFLGGFTTSYYLYCNGQHLMKRAGDAQNGAKAETQVAALLFPLQRQGWQVEYNLRIRRWGDADVVLHSPKGNWYVIDVKSHGGTKVYERGYLRKRYGRNTYDFEEGDLISKVKGQATEVRYLKGTQQVTGLLCFTKGDVDIPGNNAGDIYVVTATDLVNTLLQLDK
ncbi:NERD domain-containing protein [Nostoc sp. UHCC 0870]|uniref:NERD domain-containing protein n=1 Tax=Nostoc sp. UHCC 0870 TaxID=2914041 RepID=UPI001EE07DE5|nr:NERD domain-containing protein [Nostoc sp. UHCC 0870]UKO99994.1 NERD domain-containing protein [Nostoc sp. UHCC 0870]